MLFYPFFARGKYDKIHSYKMTIIWIFNIVDIFTWAAYIIDKQYLLVCKYKMGKAN